VAEGAEIATVSEAGAGEAAVAAPGFNANMVMGKLTAALKRGDLLFALG